MAAECMIFEEDEVLKKDNNGYMYGLVLESSEYVSSDEEDEEDNLYFERVKKGTIRVAWHPEGCEEVVTEKKIKLADRSLMPGDVVRRLIAGQDSQRGYVRNTKVRCHVQIMGKGHVICDVDSRNLRPQAMFVAEPGAGDVCLDSWVGRVENVGEQITCSFPDGARVLLDEDLDFSVLCHFEDLWEKRDQESEFYVSNYYKGQRLTGDLGSLDTATWLKSSRIYSSMTVTRYPERRITLTVEEVNPKVVEVHWLCCGYGCLEDPAVRIHPPPKVLHADCIKRLKKLDCFEPCSLQIGDKAFYTIQTGDAIVAAKPSRKSRRPIINAILHASEFPDSGLEHQKISAARKDQNKTNLSLILNEEASDPLNAVKDVETPESEEKQQNDEDRGEDNKAAHDSEYEDDSAESDHRSAASTQSGASNSSRKKKIKNRRKVLSVRTRIGQKKKKAKWSHERRQRHDPGLQPADEVPVEIIYTSSAVDVVWQDGSVETNVPSVELFPIHHLDELEFFPGDFVCPASEAELPDMYGVIETVDHAERTCTVQWFLPYEVGQSARPEKKGVPEEISVYDIKDHPDYRFRPGHIVVRIGGYEKEHHEAAGQVYELGTDGSLLIQWVNKSQSYCFPQELYLLGDELSELNDSEIDDSGSSDNSSIDDDGDSDSEFDNSWETESEQEADSDDQANASLGETGLVDSKSLETKGRGSHLCVEAEKKVELDQLLETAKTTLKKLELMFAQNIDIRCCAIHCYKEILLIHKHCRNLDHMLKACYFKDQSLVEVIGTIRKQLKEEKAIRLTQQVQEQFEAIRSLVRSSSSGPLVQTDDLKDVVAPDGSDDVSSLQLQKSSSDPNKSDGQTNNPSNLIGATLLGSEVSNDKSAVETRSIKEKVSNTADTTSGEIDGQSETEDECQPRALCERACRLLGAQIVAVQQDLEVKWKTLQASGKLRVLEEEEEEEEEEKDNKEKRTQSSDVPSSPESDKIGKLSQAANNVPVNITPTKTENMSAGATSSAQPESECLQRADLTLTLPQTPVNTEPHWTARTPATPQTPAEVTAKLLCNKEGFLTVDSMSASHKHKFAATEYQPTDPRMFATTLRKELRLLQSSLPHGVHVRGYDDRMDLYTAMIVGPRHTPYEDGLFFFDVQLPADYPNSPPTLHYISYCSERLNPNLYEDGKVCVSLLGTWSGKGTEVWTSKSSLLQVLVSIQGLILVSEPYYNEAGYEKHRGSQQGQENSRMYNEMAILKLVQSMKNLVQNPPQVYAEEVTVHMSSYADRFVRRLEHWVANTEQTETASQVAGQPDFPLLPVSKGFQLALRRRLAEFRNAVKAKGMLTAT